MPPLPPLLASRTLEGMTSQAELFEQVRPFLQAAASIRPLVIALEDAHWADPASLELLRHLLAHLRDAPVLLVVTYRIDELTRQNPFYLQLPALVQQAHGLRIDLKRLGRHDVRLFVSLQYGLDGPDADRLVAYLDQHAEGNPFFTMELLRALEEPETCGLVRTGAGWAVGELDRLVVPSLIRQVIDTRIARLGEETREPLAVAAVIGHDIPLDLWSDVAGLDEDALLAIIDRSVERRLLAVSPDGHQIQFVHALTRSSLYESVLPPRRRRMHRAVAEALIDRSPEDADAIAYHLQQAGDERALDWLIKAGDRAQRAYAWLTAGERFAAAATLLAGVPGQEVTRARLLYRRGRLQRYTDAAGGIESLDTALRLAEVAGDQVLAADITYSRGLLRCFADEWRDGLAQNIEGIELLEALPPEVARSGWSTVNWMADALPVIEMLAPDELDPAASRLMAAGVNHRRGGLAWFMGAVGRLEAAEREGLSYLSISADQPMGPLVLSSTGHATFGLGIVFAALGRPEEARTAFSSAREIYKRLDHHAVIAFTLLTELIDVIVPCLATNRSERVRAANDAQRALERAGGALPADSSARRAQLVLLYLDGRWAEAREIGADGASHGNYVMRRQITQAIAPIACFQGQYDEAWRHIRALLPDGPATEPGNAVLLDALLLQRLAAWCCLERGDPDEARRWLEANDRWLAWSGAVLGHADNLAAWAWYFYQTGEVGESRRCTDEALLAAEAPRQPLSQLAALRLRGVLARDWGARQEAEADLAASLAIADQCEIPFERAQTMAILATLPPVNGQTDRAGMLAEARRIATSLGARPLLDRIAVMEARMPTARPGTAAVTGLTARELDVLRLVAGGLTDAEIGERLFISPRTASQHLRSVYSKLELHSRAAATRFAIEHDLA
jgi:DNA-binding CsgD family transcriptional regulator/tetratricopeptide (TPR) repeat protein